MSHVISPPQQARSSGHKGHGYSEHLVSLAEKTRVLEKSPLRKLDKSFMGERDIFDFAEDTTVTSSRLLIMNFGHFSITCAIKPLTQLLG